jgi:trans-aconitate 2-methyltransferase
VSAPREWDAATYDRVAAPLTERGVAALAGLELRGDETVLDAGCGTGRITEWLLSRLPEGRVIALDASAQMLEEAAARLGEDPRVRFVQADLGRPLPLEAPVDAIVSTSTLHWVRDHDALFAHLHAALRPGGRLRADCGGAGNIARVRGALDALGVREDPWTFATPEETLERLEAAGFSDAAARLVPRPMALEPAGLRDYLRTVVLGPFVDGRAPAEAEGLVDAVAERLPDAVLDYVRLELSATRQA